SVPDSGGHSKDRAGSDRRKRESSRKRMAACRAFPGDACFVGRPCYQCKTRKRRRRDRRPLHHARQRALSNALQAVSSSYELDQQEGRERGRIALRKTRSKTSLNLTPRDTQ